MKSFVQVMLCVGAFCGAQESVASAATYNFTELNDPAARSGGFGTAALGINNAGVVVGITTAQSIQPEDLFIKMAYSVTLLTLSR